MPIVAPLLRHVDINHPYSNYHADIDDNGYYQSCDTYTELLHQTLCGVVEVPVVHCTYLVRADVIPTLNYLDTTERHEYVIFSHCARTHKIPQYLDNRRAYGYIAFSSNDTEEEIRQVNLARDQLQKKNLVPPALLSAFVSPHQQYPNLIT